MVAHFFNLSSQEAETGAEATSLEDLLAWSKFHRSRNKADPDLTRCKERVNTQMLFSGLHVHTALYALVLTHVLMNAHAHTKKDKLMYMVQAVTWGVYAGDRTE